MRGDGWVLGVDVGTSRSAGAMANGTVTPLEVDGNRWMPSMVLLDPEGRLVVGAAADHQAAVYPDRVERTPKRHVGLAAPLILGGEAVEVEAAIGRLIEAFVKEGSLRRGGQPPSATVLTHPVRWGDDRREILADSARRIGLDDLVLIDEPVAAAVHYVDDTIQVGQCVGVYDLGGGTFDTAILRRTDRGFESIGAPGGDEFIGGERFDHMILEFLGEVMAADAPELWEEIQFGEDRKWTRAAADLLTNARRAKEAVSSYPSTQVLLPLLDRDVVFTRAQFESMIRDLLDQTIGEMASTIASANMTVDELEAIYLVGGSSRIPLVTELMSEAFDNRIATRDEPKSVVALGAAQIGMRRRSPASSGPGTSAFAQDWSLSLASPVTALAATTDAVYACDEAARLHLIGTDGSSRWAAQLPAPAASRPLPVGRVVAVACTNGEIVGVDATAGHLTFRAALPGPVTTDLRWAGGIVAADATGTITLLDESGTWRWKLPLGGRVLAPPTPAGDNLLVADGDGTLYRVAVVTGQPQWATPTGAPISAAVAADGQVAYVATTAGTVYSIGLADGRTRWRTQVAGPVHGQLLRSGPSLLVPDHSGSVAALVAATGAPSGHLDVGGAPIDLLEAGTGVVCQTEAGGLVAIDPQSGLVTGCHQAGPSAIRGIAVAPGRCYVADGEVLRALRLPS